MYKEVCFRPNLKLPPSLFFYIRIFSAHNEVHQEICKVFKIDMLLGMEYTDLRYFLVKSFVILTQMLLKVQILYDFTNVVHISDPGFVGVLKSPNYTNVIQKDA